MVQTARLDDLVEKHQLSNIDLLQVDTEGFEWEVLQTPRSHQNQALAHPLRTRSHVSGGHRRYGPAISTSTATPSTSAAINPTASPSGTTSSSKID